VTTFRPDPGNRDRQARAAVGVLFASNGALFTGLLPRYPEIKDQLGLSSTAFGLSVAAFSAGALLSGLTAARLMRRFGSARVAVGGSVLVAVFTLAAGVSTAPAGLAAALFAAGAADAVTDVAQNAHGLRVQRGYGRSIINSLHAVWSVGAIFGGVVGAAAIALGIPRGVQLAGSGVVFATACVLSYRFLLPGPDHDVRLTGEPAKRSGPTSKTYAMLVALAVLAIAGAAVEDAGSSWATLYLRDELAAPAAIAAFGYIALVGFQFLGRLLGDRLVDRFGERAVVRCGGLLVAGGMGTALALPGVPATIGGFAAAGFGVAAVVPAAFHCADGVPGLSPGTGLTLVTWLMRVGFLVSPAVVGAVSDATSLRVGLLIVPVAGVVIAVVAAVLRPGSVDHGPASVSRVGLGVSPPCERVGPHADAVRRRGGRPRCPRPDDVRPHRRQRRDD
jgi:MFS family permease